MLEEAAGVPELELSVEREEEDEDELRVVLVPRADELVEEEAVLEGSAVAVDRSVVNRVTVWRIGVVVGSGSFSPG